MGLKDRKELANIMQAQRLRQVDRRKFKQFATWDSTFGKVATIMHAWRLRQSRQSNFGQFIYHMGINMVCKVDKTWWMGWRVAGISKHYASTESKGRVDRRNFGLLPHGIQHVPHVVKWQTLANTETKSEWTEGTLGKLFEFCHMGFNM